MNTNRTGKIARLPRDIRDQVNTRLDDNCPGANIVAWLNQLPAVHKVLQEHFAGVPVSEQNLTQWKAGGYQDWLARRETLAHAAELTADATELQSTVTNRLADHLATALAARYASLLANWKGGVNEAFTRQIRVLRSLAHDITHLRRGDHHVARLQLEQKRLEQDRELTKDELVKQFEAWAAIPAIRDVICQGWKSPAERQRLTERILFPHGNVPPK